MGCTCGSAAGEVCVACIGSGQGSGTQRGQGDVAGSVCNGAYAGIHAIRNGDITTGCAAARGVDSDCEGDRDSLADHRWVGEIAGDRGRGAGLIDGMGWTCGSAA